ncbi:zinc finger protein 431-like isoform X1 [Pieris napi]|uniref:zinc finger protein 431-like isoform X1 n=1 Tax=Pieris napi TaxID=78633 RepID=UPI001FBAADBA|nr:zinc finger protein 431-like isoform X1 [Pieris napi]
MNETSYGQCRCCLVSGYHKSMTEEHEEQRDTYIDMFLECFNLFLSTNSELTCLICKSCLEELHRANKFKAMVIQNEQKLLAMSSNNDVMYVNLPRPIETDVDFKLESIKLEPLSDNEHVELDNDSDYINSDGNDQDDATIDHIDGEAELLARFPGITKLPIRDTLYTNACAGYVKHLDLLKGKLISSKMISNIIEDAERENGGKKIYITEKTAQILNTSIILENSNVTPFKSRNRSGFPCFYCRSIFEDLPNLKSHQDKLHSKADIKRSLNAYGAECLVVYVDITDLKCKLCDKEMPNLNELKTHLTRIHKKHFYSDYTDRVIPFRLVHRENKFECQMCGFTFETFGSIERHMNVHFRNYVCKECGTGFVTKYRLKVHTKSMHVGGSYPCEICKKVFTTQQKHKNHVDAVHKLVKRFKCPHCPERFSEYFKRQKHIVEIHDGPPLQYKCNVCDKSFDRRYTLSRHMKRDHLEERDFQCQLCAYKCFTKNELRVHMVKHNGERIFECSVCHKSYARKKTLREHMRIHNNDRRFACAVCGQAFVQKCSLKGHIKTHHVDYNLPI